MDEPIPDHLAAIATGRDVPRLLSASSGSDVLVPAAREWVRRWGPARALASMPACSCAAGRCVVCN